MKRKAATLEELNNILLRAIEHDKKQTSSEKKKKAQKAKRKIEKERKDLIKGSKRQWLCTCPKSKPRGKGKHGIVDTRYCAHCGGIFR